MKCQYVSTFLRLLQIDFKFLYKSVLFQHKVYKRLMLRACLRYNAGFIGEYKCSFIFSHKPGME